MKRKREHDLERNSQLAKRIKKACNTKLVIESKVRTHQLTETAAQNFTVSVALPGSIISNAQTQELRTYLAGQIARALTIYKVHEVIIFTQNGDVPRENSRGKSDPNLFLVRLLQYLETPQYLRKALFPLHPDLRFAGCANPLDAAHHLRRDQKCRYREGVVEKCDAEGFSFVNIGLRQPVKIKKKIKVNTRVTIDLSEEANPTPVSPHTPRKKHGLYWGYSVRLAVGLERALTSSPFEEPYDLIVGTSERGEVVQTSDFKLPKFKHLLIVFGGVEGLEVCRVSNKRFRRPDLAFDMYVNTCEKQGSGTIRTEEAVLVSLSVLAPHICKN